MDLTQHEWEEKISFFRENYNPCNLCPRRCGALRQQNESGACRVAVEPNCNVPGGAEQVVKIASCNLHFGEEPPISGEKGSGTIFFSGCTMQCIFCQNYPISHLHHGKYYSIEELSKVFLYLQERGAHNINFVSPTPYLYHIVRALWLSRQQGLTIPIVYNTSGYERPEIIRALEKIIQVYLPDFKYDDDRLAREFSRVTDYTQFAQPAIEEMFRQVGDCVTDAEGIATRGLIIRHLLLPGHVENSKKVLQRIASSSFKGVHLSLMSQYFPAHRAAQHPIINRQVTLEEYAEVEEYALELGFENGWFQDPQAQGGA